MVHAVGSKKKVFRRACAKLVCNFDELHFSPELRKVDNQKCHNDNSEDKHVLRCPFHAFGAGSDGIAVVAAGFAVLQRKPKRINNVYNETGS